MQDLPAPRDPAGVPHRYQALFRALSEPTPTVIELRFVEIHRLGSNLPHRARTDETWWSNDPAGDPQREAWLTAGRRVQKVDVERSRVWFAAEALPVEPPPPSDEPAAEQTNETPS